MENCSKCKKVLNPTRDIYHFTFEGWQRPNCATHTTHNCICKKCYNGIHERIFEEEYKYKKIRLKLMETFNLVEKDDKK